MIRVRRHRGVDDEFLSVKLESQANIKRIVKTRIVFDGLTDPHLFDLLVNVTPQGSLPKGTKVTYRKTESATASFENAGLKFRKIVGDDWQVYPEYTLATLKGTAEKDPAMLIGIARGIVTDPTLLLCDEPTGDLDRKAGDEILDLLQTLNRDYGKTIVMVTHDPHAADRARRTLHLDKGVLVGSVPA